MPLHCAFGISYICNIYCCFSSAPRLHVTSCFWSPWAKERECAATSAKPHIPHQKPSAVSSHLVMKSH